MHIIQGSNPLLGKVEQNSDRQCNGKITTALCEAGAMAKVESNNNKYL